MSKQKQAFTLVELIVVITILAILGTIAFISLQGYSAQSRDSVRISDVSTMKTSLELFHLNAGKYPLPDNLSEVSYDTDLLWSQGIFGRNVIQNLSRNISEIPLDPITSKKYIYSVQNNKNAFEILSLMEGEEFSLNNNLNQAQAGNLEVTPKIDGTYNGIFVKTPNYIIPTPSIINAGIQSDDELNATNITSQIINKGENVPNNVGNVQSNTGALSNLKLSVFTGSINNDLTKEKKLEIIDAIKGAYTGSSLANEGVINIILNTTDEDKLVTLTETVVLNKSSISKSTNDVPLVATIKTVADCKASSNAGDVIYGTLDGLSDGTDMLTCDDDIIICDGTGEGNGITIRACNQGQTDIEGYNTCVSTNGGFNATTDCTVALIGDSFQFGRNEPYPTWTNQQLRYIPDWKSPGGLDGGSANDWGVFHANRTTTTYNTPLGSTNIGLMKGPCSDNYHVPTNKEWNNLVNLKWDKNDVNLGTALKNDLKLSYAGRRIHSDASFENRGGHGHYWSSSPNVNDGYYFHLNHNTINPNQYNSRASGYGIRCFKN